ncbi:transcription elongation factor GreA [Candidatus Falkowbacteria bacterium]|jgi:transcription elongation factor GreA|nr:transcription elongation factor GreA [Patescibacteria group bacterium]MDD3435227.1 transcription elongation factor GreA [Patescibacteria group bacterium]MDD4466583.1 transcription elongation factor GreA [Patescibacteria group bacterium]NCU43280.1 transcription elongation factor GreA [Candidatus Falkowbacteria bacterium]
MSLDQIITQAGYDKLKEEYDFLTTVKRREIADRIERAKDLGDLSENAEYSEAKDAQALNEGRILELLAILKNVTVVNHKSNGEVVLGSVVTAKVNGKEKEFTIVSFNEADPTNGLISNESPLGVAFLGQKKGAIVEVEAPRGTVVYKIIKVA